MDLGIPPDTLGLPGQCFTLRIQVSIWDFRAFAEDNMRFDLKLALFKLQSEVSPIFQVSCATKAGLDRRVVKWRYNKKQNLTVLRVAAKLACMEATSTI